MARGKADGWKEVDGIWWFFVVSMGVGGTDEGEE